MNSVLNRLKNEEGSGLILALMTLMVLSVLGAALGFVTIGSFRLSSVNRDSTSAYYIAEAGVNQAFEEMSSLINSAYESSTTEEGFFSIIESSEYKGGKTITGFGNQFGDSPEAHVELVKLNTSGRTRSYLLISKGKVDSRNRIVEKRFDITWIKEVEKDIIPKTPEGVALISNGKMEFFPNTKVKGHVQTTDLNNFKLNRGNRKIEDVVEGRVYTSISNWGDYTELAGNFPDISEFDKKLDDTDKREVTVDTSNNKFLTYYTDNLYLKNFKVKGNGVVNIYVKNSLIFDGDDFNLENDFRNVRIYYAGEKMSVNKDYQFNASLFVEDADISISNKVTFSGVLLYGGNKNIKLGVKADFIETYLIAPFAQVHLRNHVELTGTLIAKSVIMDNHAIIQYKEVGDFPFSFKGSGAVNDDDLGDMIDDQPIREQKWEGI